MGTGVPDSSYEAARAVFDEKQLVDLTTAISLMNAYNHADQLPEHAADRRRERQGIETISAKKLLRDQHLRR